MVDQKYPLRSELTVLPADPKRESLGWTIVERDGVEVCRVDRDQKPVVVKEPLLKEDDLHAGMELAVPGLMGGYHLMTVERDEQGRLYAKGDRMSAILEFAKDDRLAWVCCGLINLRGIAKLEVQR